MQQTPTAAEALLAETVTAGLSWRALLTYVHLCFPFFSCCLFVCGPHVKLFWPISAWKSSGLVVILDNDSVGDHRVGTILQNLNLPSRIDVRYEAPPPKGTTCGGWRREGYSRQQWSNFYADLYSDAEYVAIIDTDAAFISPGKPIICETQASC